MRTIPLAACLAASLAGGLRGATATGLKEGLSFPDLRLPSLSDGTLRSISEFLGKKTLLIVYASW